MSLEGAIDQMQKARVPFWPVVLAPLVAGIYYLSLKLAFAESVIPVLGRADLFETPHWGSHWAFRLIAEAISIGFGAFVAAALAPGREKAAAVVGGCTISLGFAAKLAILYADPTTIPGAEPWYQFAIDALWIVLAPMVGAYVSEAATDMHGAARGVGGISRFHFLWLWLPAYFYALGLVTPIGRMYGVSNEGLVAMIVVVIVNGIPAVALAIPAYYGLAFLAGHHGESMHPAGRNMVGLLVLVSGFGLGAAIQFGWYWIIEKIHAALFE
ncbi:hypothetical protein ACQR10_09555 [Bradyrhizobium sp. HKCCYLRH2060]|uniref:hypothetical protein n=1 Tax=Bradyrhizobium TaxID=374 RepID=UPI003EBB81FD